MDAEKELLIFRIAQEAFNNIIKHSGAKHIKLCMCYYNSYVELIIKDDGKGFDMALIGNQTKGAGLNNIKLRTKVLNGEAHIFSAPGEGTSINISIPYPS